MSASSSPFSTSQDDQLMSKHAFSASRRMFDLTGEASTERTKQISAIIGLTWKPILTAR